MRRACTIVAILSSGLSQADAQALSLGGPDQSDTLLFVPSLPGALTLDVMFEGRLDGIVEPGVVPLAENVLTLSAGYLHYLDGHGRLAVGGYLSGGAAVTRAQPDWPNLSRFDVGITARGRGMSHDFKHWTLAIFAEFGVVHAFEGAQSPPAPAGTPLDSGTRWAIGVETGPGMLFHLSPYVFGELVGRIGMEWMFFEHQRYATLTAGMRLKFDYALLGDDD